MSLLLPHKTKQIATETGVFAMVDDDTPGTVNR
jgi:hypothetical protein